MRDLAISFPDRRDWEYAVGKLRNLTKRSYPYLVKCLETSCKRRGAIPKAPAPYTRPKNHAEDWLCERCWPFKNLRF